MAEFRIPNKIIHGKGSAQQLSSLKGQRLLMVYDNPYIEDHALKFLSASGITVRTFEANPNYTDTLQIMEGTKAMMEFKPEWVLAAGSHGAIDLAKLIRVFYQRPDLSPENANQGMSLEINLDKTRMIALPLYNTNGDEATCSAYIADIGSGYESPLSVPALIPDITIIDPDMLAFSNGTQEALCVMSTFVLAIEAAADISSDSFVRPLALEAIRILAKNVLAHSAAPSHGAPLLYAQCLAGMAHTNSAPGLGSTLCRASAFSFGPISFGELGAVLLPAIIRQDKHPEKYLAAAKAMGLDDAASLADAVHEYADMLGLPLTLGELGVSKNAFLKKVSKISHRVLSLLPSKAQDEKEAQKHIEQILRMSYSAKEL